MSFLSSLRPSLRSALVLIGLMLLISISVKAQTVTTTTSITDGRTPSGFQPGAPNGAYGLDNFDTVNLYNGNLNFHLPLLKVGGRGSANMTITLALNLKRWRIKHTHKEFPDGNTLDSYVPTQLGWSPYDGYGVGQLSGRHYGLHTSQNLTCRWYSKTLSRITFSAADGTEYELRDQLTNGQPLNSTCSQGANRGTVFITADGTAATFISDAPVIDNPAVNPFGPSGFTVSGLLKLRDGTTYRIDSGNITWIRDRNGNKISFVYSASSMTITDSINRQITVNYDVSDIAPFGLCDQIIFKGFGGTQRILRVSKTNLGSALRSGYSLKTLGGTNGLFPESNGSTSTYHDPTVRSSVWLPDGRRYRFYYNSYGELARVELPSGGAVEYDMTATSGIHCLNFCWPDDDRQIYRRLIERRVYPDGSTGSSYERKDIYANTEAVGSTTSTVTVEQVNSAGTVLARSRHQFDGSALDSLFLGAVPHPYEAWYQGNEKQTEILDTAGNITTAVVLRKTVTDRAQRASVSWWASYAGTVGLPVAEEPPNDPRVTQLTHTIEPSTANLVTKQTFGYDDTVPFNNQNNVKDYDVGNGVAGDLLRETRTTFVTDPTYTGTSVHLRSLALQISTFDGNGFERARSNFEFDNYTFEGPDCALTLHCPLTPRSSISGFDSGFGTAYTTRGNVTAVTTSVFTNGTITGSVTGHSHYDVAGNVVRARDLRGFVTHFDFADRYGSPDTEAQSNNAVVELASQTSYAFPTKITNALGHLTYTQLDYYLGRPVNSEDSNGVVSSMFFDDLLDRPSKAIAATNQGALVKAQTDFDYDDVNRSIITKTDKDVFEDPNPIKMESIYDGLGRAIETRQYETAGSYITVKTQYDALGRTWKVSNPFRSGETIVWTTTSYDALGRVNTVTTPDNAVVTTSYSGNTATVTDPANKRRKSVSDGLGRLTRVYEDPEVPGGPAELDYLTTYTYDVLDNVVKVTQGSQQRFFMYDSLSRLIRVRNPEQDTRPSLDLTDSISGNSAWSAGYQYDANSNLTQMTDARGVVSTHVYDALNRITTTNYSNTTIDPDVKRFYDGAEKGIGRFWYFYSGGDYSTEPNVDHTSIDSYDALGRPLVQRQLFKLNHVWSPTYQTARTYNRTGAVSSITYPSGRTVSYNYDLAGRLGDKNAGELAFTGNLGDGVQRTYARGVSYSPWSNLAREQFGTNTAVYHKLRYNIRGQLCDVRASNVNDDMGGELGALVNYFSTAWQHCGSGVDNNGSVLMSQTIINSYYMEDRYSYDALNRLTAVDEWQNATTHTGSQQYEYDRWGNRKIKPATWGTGINNKQFTVDETVNRLYAPGDLGLPESQRQMRYDAAGNLTNDTYTGAGLREYDAENRMTRAWGGNNQSQYYTYNADGQRTRRKVDNQETWQIYGFDGELLAEYAANGTPTSPQKEYGYRNGQLLITAEPGAPESPAGVNVASASSGAVATASSNYAGVTPSNANNGDHVGTASWWADGTSNTYPDWIQVDFAGAKTISEIDVFGLQQNYSSPVEPTPTMTSSYAMTNFEVQYWTGSAWATVPGGSVTGNDKVWRKFTFASLNTTKIRVHVTHVAGDNHSQVVEIEAYGPQNVASTSSGAVATASSNYSGITPSNANNGDHVGTASWWADGTSNTYPDWIQVDFAGAKTINEIDVFGLQQNYGSPVEPTPTMTSSYAMTNFEVQYWTGSAWATVPGGSVTGNDKVWRKFTFAPLNTTKIRVHVTHVAGDNHSQVVEIEAYGATSPSSLRWLVADHLGTPRMIIDQTGTLANIKRHDYLPFGEELFAGTGGRTAQNGYVGGDGVRQQFTGYERDIETGLDFAQARYHANVQGRFTSVDPGNAGAVLDNPQSWNGYSYVQNDPLNFVDPTGLVGCGAQHRTCAPEKSLSENEAAERRHDSIINSAYDPTLEIYRGRVDVQYTTDHYSITTTLNNPTQDEVEAAADRLEASTAMVAQRNYRPPVRPANNPRLNPANYKRDRKGRMQYVGPRSWKEGLHFVNLGTHYRKHSDLPRWEYLYQARMHTKFYGARFKVFHEGQWKYNYVTRIGPDQFIFTSTSLNGNYIFTHMTKRDDVTSKYLRAKGITLPKGF